MEDGRVDAHKRLPLEDLVKWRGKLSELIRAAQHDHTTRTVTFDLIHAAAAAEKGSTGLVSPRELTDWAQAVHFAELDIEDEHQDVLTQFLLEMSTPELFESVTVEVCQRWLHVIRASLASEESGPARPNVQPEATQAPQESP